MKALSARTGLREIWSQPLPYQREQPLTRLLCRLVLTLAKRRVLEVRGLEHVAPDLDPFIFVANHNQRLEAILLPTLLVYHRGGKPIHFLADWPTMMVPFAGLLLRRGEVITVTRKRARLRFLNVFKPLFARRGSAFAQARAKLEGGAPVGIFPEATMNRDPRSLLRGQTGAAKLSLLTGAPVVAAGIRFPGQDPRQPIRDGAAMILTLGAPVPPPRVSGPDPQTIRAFHARIMGEIARLSSKQWNQQAPRRRIHVSQKAAQRPQSRERDRPPAGPGGLEEGLPEGEVLGLRSRRLPASRGLRPAQ